MGWKGSTVIGWIAGRVVIVDVDFYRSPGYMGKLEPHLGISVPGPSRGVAPLQISLGRSASVYFSAFDLTLFDRWSICSTICIFNKRVFGVVSLVDP